jgi:hypothetical protein
LREEDPLVKFEGIAIGHPGNKISDRSFLGPMGKNFSRFLPELLWILPKVGIELPKDFG